MKVEDVGLLNFGNTIQLVGGIWQGENRTFYAFFPGEDEGDYDAALLEVEDWEAFMRQLDLLEVELLAKAKDGKIVKAVLRKSARQVDTRVSWKVYARDGYACRYCGREGGDVPLTVDHVVTWEEGGPSIEDNLVTACKKCNRIRGNLGYEEWINSEEYQERKAINLSQDAHAQNVALIPTLKTIPRRVHRVKR